MGKESDAPESSISASSQDEEEARKALLKAENYLAENHPNRALNLLLKAQRLNPNLKEVSEAIAVAQVCSAKNNSLKISDQRCVCKGGGPSSSVFMDWYQILQVEANNDDSTIRKKYRQLALILHPDKNKHAHAEEAFKLVSEAYNVLSDKNKRNLFNIQKGRIKSNCVCGMNKSHFFSSSSVPSPLRSTHVSSSSTSEREKENEKFRDIREKARSRIHSLEKEWEEKKQKWEREMREAKERAAQRKEAWLKNMNSWEKKGGDKEKFSDTVTAGEESGEKWNEVDKERDRDKEKIEPEDKSDTKTGEVVEEGNIKSNPESDGKGVEDGDGLDEIHGDNSQKDSVYTKSDEVLMDNNLNDGIVDDLNDDSNKTNDEHSNANQFSETKDSVIELETEIENAEEDEGMEKRKVDEDKIKVQSSDTNTENENANEKNVNKSHTEEERNISEQFLSFFEHMNQGEPAHERPESAEMEGKYNEEYNFTGTKEVNERMEEDGTTGSEKVMKSMSDIMELDDKIGGEERPEFVNNIQNDHRVEIEIDKVRQVEINSEVEKKDEEGKMNYEQLKESDGNVENLNESNGYSANAIEPNMDYTVDHSVKILESIVGKAEETENSKSAGRIIGDKDRDREAIRMKETKDTNPEKEEKSSEKRKIKKVKKSKDKEKNTEKLRKEKKEFRSIDERPDEDEHVMPVDFEGRKEEKRRKKESDPKNDDKNLKRKKKRKMRSTSVLEEKNGRNEKDDKAKLESNENNIFNIMNSPGFKENFHFDAKEWKNPIDSLIHNDSSNKNDVHEANNNNISINNDERKHLLAVHAEHEFDFNHLEKVEEILSMFGKNDDTHSIYNLHTSHNKTDPMNEMKEDCGNDDVGQSNFNFVSNEVGSLNKASGLIHENNRDYNHDRFNNEWQQGLEMNMKMSESKIRSDGDTTNHGIHFENTVGIEGKRNDDHGKIEEKAHGNDEYLMPEMKERKNMLDLDEPKLKSSFKMHEERGRGDDELKEEINDESHLKHFNISNIDSIKAFSKLKEKQKQKQNENSNKDEANEGGLPRMNKYEDEETNQKLVKTRETEITNELNRTHLTVSTEDKSTFSKGKKLKNVGNHLEKRIEELRNEIKEEIAKKIKEKKEERERSKIHVETKMKKNNEQEHKLWKTYNKIVASEDSESLMQNLDLFFGKDKPKFSQTEYSESLDFTKTLKALADVTSANLKPSAQDLSSSEKSDADSSVLTRRGYSDATLSNPKNSTMGGRFYAASSSKIPPVKSVSHSETPENPIESQKNDPNEPKSGSASAPDIFYEQEPIPDSDYSAITTPISWRRMGRDGNSIAITDQVESSPQQIMSENKRQIQNQIEDFVTHSQLESTLTEFLKNIQNKNFESKEEIGFSADRNIRTDKKLLKKKIDSPTDSIDSKMFSEIVFKLERENVEREKVKRNLQKEMEKQCMMDSWKEEETKETMLEQRREKEVDAGIELEKPKKSKGTKKKKESAVEENDEENVEKKVKPKKKKKEEKRKSKLKRESEKGFEKSEKDDELIKELEIFLEKQKKYIEKRKLIKLIKRIKWNDDENEEENENTEDYDSDSDYKNDKHGHDDGKKEDMKSKAMNKENNENRKLEAEIIEKHVPNYHRSSPIPNHNIDRNLDNIGKNVNSNDGMHGSDSNPVLSSLKIGEADHVPIHRSAQPSKVSDVNAEDDERILFYDVNDKMEDEIHEFFDSKNDAASHQNHTNTEQKDDKSKKEELISEKEVEAIIENMIKPCRPLFNHSELCTRLEQLQKERNELEEAKEKEKKKKGRFFSFKRSEKSSNSEKTDVEQKITRSNSGKFSTVKSVAMDAISKASSAKKAAKKVLARTTSLSPLRSFHKYSPQPMEKSKSVSVMDSARQEKANRVSILDAKQEHQKSESSNYKYNKLADNQETGKQKVVEASDFEDAVSLQSSDPGSDTTNWKSPGRQGGHSWTRFFRVVGASGGLGTSSHWSSVLDRPLTSVWKRSKSKKIPSDEGFETNHHHLYGGDSSCEAYSLRSSERVSLEIKRERHDPFFGKKQQYGREIELEKSNEFERFGKEDSEGSPYRMGRGRSYSRVREGNRKEEGMKSPDCMNWSGALFNVGCASSRDGRSEFVGGDQG